MASFRLISTFLLLNVLLIFPQGFGHSPAGRPNEKFQKSRTSPSDSSKESSNGHTASSTPPGLELFAFGQVVQLGALYDIRTQTFFNDTIFSSPLFAHNLIISEGKESTYESEGLVEKPSDEFRLLDLNPRQALGILLGQGPAIPSRGSTGFLWNVDQHGVDSNGVDENGGLDEQLEGTFKYSIKYLKTAEERLNLQHAHMPFGVDFAKLKKSRATHVLVSIQYGVGLTVRIPLGTPNVRSSKAKTNMDFAAVDELPSHLRLSSKYGPEVFSDIELADLEQELGKIRAEVAAAKDNVTFVSEETETEGPITYSDTETNVHRLELLKTRGNSKEKVFSKDDAETLLRSFPHHLQGFRKGIPLKYGLLSIRDFVKQFVDDDSAELSELPQISFPNSQVDYFNMERALSTFDGITLMRRSLAQLEKGANRHANLLRDEDLRKITIVKRHFQKTSDKLKEQLKHVLVNAPLDTSAIEHGAAEPFDLNQEIQNIIENYQENIYSFASVNETLKSVEFKHTLEKMKLLDYIKSTGVLYLGRGATVSQLQLNHHADLDSQNLFQDGEVPIKTYILFFKDLSSASSKLKWLQTRSIFFNLHFQNSDFAKGVMKLVVVDCNFAWAFEECENIWDQPVIHEYHGDTLVSNDYPNNVTVSSKYENITNAEVTRQDVELIKGFGTNLIGIFGALKRTANRAIAELQKMQTEGEARIKTQTRTQLRDLSYALRGTLFNVQYEVAEAEDEILSFLRYFEVHANKKIRTGLGAGEGMRAKTNKGTVRKPLDFPIVSRRSGTRRRNSRSKTDAFSSVYGHDQDLTRTKAKRPSANVKNNKNAGSQGNCHLIEHGVTMADQKEILKRHNALREFVAAGKEKRGSPGPQPAAKHMERLEWDEELAKDAQRAANRCELQLNQQKTKTSSLREVGQNLKVRGNFYNHTRKNNPVLPADWTGTIDRWYDQVTSFDSRIVPQFGSPQTETDAYTQMVWGKTNKVGCGYSQFTAVNEKGQEGVRRLYLCYYGPKGNQRDQPVYSIRTRG